MQDIVFYAAANETLGTIRDYANERNSPAPVLTLGVSVCLRMRLFSSTEGATPYPIASLNGISDWQWSMDSDFDRATASKLVADAGGISVHTETDTVNGETMNFTEFVIPISNMNTEELAAWLGNEKMKSGLTGELVGYDSGGNAAFVLQIENFSVRNRVAGLVDPTALDQEIVTRTQAEYMIRTAVSSSADTKQDKLTLANAGAGISITSSGVISTADVPQSAVTGLPETLAAKQDNLTAGFRMALVSGSTVDQARYFAIEPAITASANRTTTVVLSAGKAYEIHAVANNAKVLLNREDPPDARTFGLEGHAEIFVANTGYIQTGENVVLANALEPDAVNNCTVRFHDGLAIISVEDHVAGYIVVSATGTTAGTLPYALSSAGQEYVAIDGSLNGQTIDLGGVVASAGERHVVGNGYAETIVSGGITCTSKTTFSNLGMDGVVNSGGTMTLGDVHIPSGATVSATGGTAGGVLYIEKARLDGTINVHADTIVDTLTGSGMIDLGNYSNTYNHRITNRPGKLLVMSGVTIRGGYSVNWGTQVFIAGGTAVCTSCTFTDGRVSAGKNGVFGVDSNGKAILKGCTFNNNTMFGDAVCIGGVQTKGYSYELDSCVFSSNNTPAGKCACFMGNASGTIVNSITDCEFQAGQAIRLFNNAIVELHGSNTIDQIIDCTSGSSMSSTGRAVIASGAIIDLTGNTNATPIAPGGGITLYGGGASNPTKIYGSAGSTTESRAFGAECTITGSAVTKIGAISGATVTLSSSSCELDFIKSGEETVSSAFMQDSESPYVLETQQGSGAVLVRVAED